MLKRSLCAVSLLLLAIGGAFAQSAPGGRLTLISGQPVMQADISAVSTLYYAPYKGGDHVSVLDATLTWQSIRFTSGPLDTVGLSLTGGTAWASSSQYDAFVGLSGSTPVLCTGSAWPNPNATFTQRGLTPYDGLPVNGGAITCNTGSAISISCPQYQCTWVGSINVDPASSSSAGAPISIGSNTSGSSPVSLGSLSTTAAIQAGDLVAVAVCWNVNNVTPISGITDGVNSYVKAKNAVQGTGGSTSVELWYKENAAARPSGTTITASISPGTTGGSAGFSIQAVRVPGILSSGSLDQTQAAAGSTPSLTLTTAALASASEVALGISCDGNQPTSYSGASGFSNVSTLSQPGGNAVASFDFLQTTSAGSITYKPTYSTTSFRIAAALATFQYIVAPPTGGTLSFLTAWNQNRRIDVWNRYQQETASLHVGAPWTPASPNGNYLIWTPITQYPTMTPFNNDTNNNGLIFTGEPENVSIDYAQSGFINTSGGGAGFVATIGLDGALCGFWDNFEIDTASLAIGFNSHAHCDATGLIGQHTATQLAAGANAYGGVVMWGGVNPSAGFPYSQEPINHNNDMTVTYRY